LAKLARKKITIVWRMSGFFVFCLLLTHLLTRRPLMFKGKKKNGKTHPPLLVEERERDPFCYSLFIKYKIRNSFFSFIFNKCRGNKERERPIFSSSFVKNRNRKKPNVLPLEKKLSHTKFLA
jgi:hypothetical protein